jgi:hypothetical protein
LPTQPPRSQEAPDAARATLVAIVLKNTAVATPSYLHKLGLVTLVGVTASLLIDGGDAVWWQVPWQWKLCQAVYHSSVWIIAGAILAPFVSSPKPTLVP